MSEEPRPKRKRLEEDIPVSALLCLPPEVMVLICGYLTVRDKLCLKLVNKQTYSLLSDDVFWREIRIEQGEMLHKSFVRLIFKIFPDNLKHLQLPKSVYCNTQNLKKLSSKCKSIEKLSWASSRVGNLSILPSDSLTHLHLNMSRIGDIYGASLPISVFENLKHVVLNEQTCDQHFCDNWSRANFKPPLIAVVQNKKPWDQNEIDFIDKVEAIDAAHAQTPACVSLYEYIKPKMLPFCEVPASNRSVGPLSKIYAKVEGPDTYPLLVIDTAVNPDIFQPNSTYKFGSVYILEHAPPIATVPYATVCTDKLHCLDFYDYQLHHNFLATVFSQAPHLIQLNLSDCTLLPGVSLDGCLSTLPSSCPLLKGLNIRANYCVCDKQHLWHILSQMKCLEYLAISNFMLVAGSESSDYDADLEVEVVIDDTAAENIKSSIREMTSLRALQVYVNYLDLVRNIASVESALACFKTLQYFNGASHMVLSVLKNNPNLHTVGVYENCAEYKPELYDKLDNLAINSISTTDEFVSAITQDTCQLKRLGLITRSLPTNAVIDILNGVPSLCTFEVHCHVSRLRSLYKIKEAKKLACDKNVNLTYDLTALSHDYDVQFTDRYLYKHETFLF